MTKTDYAYSLNVTRVREDAFDYNNSPMTSSGAVLDFVKTLQDADIEKFLVLYLDVKLKLSCIQITTGTIDQCQVYPREIAKHALLSGATSVIMVHNHPSGVPSPSSQDKELTKILKTALEVFQIKVQDHIIIGEGTYYSFAEQGLM